MRPPQPPGKKDARRFPRFEIYASVEVRHGGETLILPARNISLGGLLVAADGHDLKKLPLGTEVDLLLFDAMDEEKPRLRAPAKIMRHDSTGMALMWTTSDPDVAIRLASLLEALRAV